MTNQASSASYGGGGSSSGSDLTFQTESLPAFTVGQVFDFDIKAVGGVPPYQFQLTQGSLPDGIGLSATGKVSGTPTQAGDLTAFVKLSDAGGADITQAFNCQVN